MKTINVIITMLTVIFKFTKTKTIYKVLKQLIISAFTFRINHPENGIFNQLWVIMPTLFV